MGRIAHCTANQLSWAVHRGDIDSISRLLAWSLLLIGADRSNSNLHWSEYIVTLSISCKSRFKKKKKKIWEGVAIKRKYMAPSCLGAKGKHEAHSYPLMSPTIYIYICMYVCVCIIENFNFFFSKRKRKIQQKKGGWGDSVWLYSWTPLLPCNASCTPWEVLDSHGGSAHSLRCDMPDNLHVSQSPSAAFMIPRISF